MSRLYANNGRLDGVVDYATNQCTFGCWIKRGASATDTMIHFGPVGSPDGFYIQVSSTGTVLGVISASGSAVSAAATLVINDTTTWHLVLATVQDTGGGILKVTAEVDGGNTGTQPLTRTPALAAAVRIGARLDGTGFLTGRIAHAFRYRVLLTQAERTALYTNLPPSVRPADLEFYDDLLNNRSPEIDDIGGVELAITNATYDTDNPPLGPPIIQSVSTVQQGASVTITGLVLKPTGVAPTVTFGGITQTVNSSSDTSITINSASLNRYGDDIVTVTNSFSLSDSLSVPLLPATGLAYVNLTTLASVAQRLTTSPDLQLGWQIRYESTDAQVLEDASFITDDSLAEFDFAVNDGTGYGASATQVLEDPSTPPVKTGVLAPITTYLGSPTQLNVADGATGWTVISEVGSTLTALGLSLSSVGLITGSPTVSGSYSITIRYTNLDGFVDQTPFTLTIIGSPVVSGIPPNLVYSTSSGIQVIDFRPYFTDATDYSINPPGPIEWEFADGVLTIDPRTPGLTGPYIVTGSNPAGSASLTPFSIFIETVNQIIFSTTRRTVNERSSVVVVAKFRGRATNAAVLPTSVMYRLDGEAGEVQGWTTLTPASSVTITIASAQTAVSSNRRTVSMRLSVAADFGLPTQCIATLPVTIKNQPYTS